MQEINSDIELAEITKRILEVLTENRKYLNEDGGDIEFIRLYYDTYKKSRVLKADIRFLGECKKCPLSSMTLRAGIEKAIKEKVPEIFRIEEII